MKRKILDALAKQLEAEVRALEAAAHQAAEAATHEESRAEGQHDTRSIEASYLAAGHARRAEELKMSLHGLASFHPRDGMKSVDAGALVTAIADEQKALWFLCPYAGGHKVTVEGKNVQILSLQSPLALELVGKSAGDEVTVGSRIWLLDTVH